MLAVVINPDLILLIVSQLKKCFVRGVIPIVTVIETAIRLSVIIVEIMVITQLTVLIDLHAGSVKIHIT